MREYRQVLTIALRRRGHPFPHRPRPAPNTSKREGSAADELEARRAFEAELALDPTNANAAYELAEMHRGAGELDPRRTLFEQAVAHHPAFEHARIGLARTLIALDTTGRRRAAPEGCPRAEPRQQRGDHHVARANRALGDSAAQQMALAQFNRTRALAAERAAAMSQTKQDVTPQVLDPDTPR